MSRRSRSGFTLVELVVVVLILGILAAVALPKMISVTGNATDNGLKQTLTVVRDAIELYRAENAGAYPPGTDQATFKTALVPYLRGSFPKCPVANKNTNVKITTTGTTITVSGTEGWHYHSLTGQFIVNSTAASTSDATVTYDTF